MTFTEMIVKTHPNDDIGNIIVDGKCYPLLTYNRDLPGEEIPPYWIDEKNFILSLQVKNIPALSTWTPIRRPYEN